MPNEAQIRLSFTPDELQQLATLAEADAISPSNLVRRVVRQFLQDSLGGDKSSTKDPVEYLLRPGERVTENPQWTDGGRWLLDWLLLAEPDWQKHHMTMLPRHWPIPEPGRREHRCSNNGGGDLGWNINDFIREWRYPTEHPGELPCFPADFPELSREQWIEIVARFRGCCAERLRAPNDPHWESVCG